MFLGTWVYDIGDLSSGTVTLRSTSGNTVLLMWISVPCILVMLLCYLVFTVLDVQWNINLMLNI